MPTIDELPTPALLLDRDVLEQNLARMAERAREWGVALRPHVKTHKCIEIGRRQRELGARGITVATLQEARDFADSGFDDMTWAFPVIPSRIRELEELAERVTIRPVVDSLEAIEALERTGRAFPTWLKVDAGYHRAGVNPQGAYALRVAERLARSRRLHFDGLLSHSGQAYRGPAGPAVAAAAREERDGMLAFAERLRRAGIEVPGISVGSTPGLTAIDHLDGITEIRPGNYAFYDYTQVVLGACRPADCALTVLATVVSSQPDAHHSIVDAGALALSKDPGHPGADPPTMGEIYAEYAAGTLRADARLVALSQEHGRVEGRLPLGARIRILPNHSCLTAACFDAYDVVSGDEVVDRWPIRRRR